MVILTIFVRNADHSRDWYTSTLGLKVEFEVPSPRAVALQDSGGSGCSSSSVRLRSANPHAW